MALDALAGSSRHETAFETQTPGGAQYWSRISSRPAASCWWRHGLRMKPSFFGQGSMRLAHQYSSWNKELRRYLLMGQVVLPPCTYPFSVVARPLNNMSSEMPISVDLRP
jgi:hypothetical protein